MNHELLRNDEPSRLHVAQRLWLRREFLSLLTSSAISLTLLRRDSGGDPQTPARLPNFIIILADDLGYGDLGCYGSQLKETPRLDLMAAQGIRFTDFYAASPVCTPSRAALLTGCYGQRIGLSRVLFPHSRIGLHPDEITMAELLKKRDYVTACIGKWHLGHQERFLPTRNGFDRFFGLLYSNDMLPLTLMRGDEVIEEPIHQKGLTERYTAEAIRFIAEQRSRPFFLYLPHTAPHVPLHVSDRFRGRSKGGLYGDVIISIDWSTGEILDTLAKLDLEKDTLVIFTSDNGPATGKGKSGGSSLPLRGAKHTTWEGGMRIPCIMRWPGRIPAGRVCSEMTTTMDLYPTLAGLAGAPIPTDRVVDGKDIWPLMAGWPEARSPHEAYFYFRGNYLEAVRSGRWKLHLKRTLKVQGKKTETIPRRLFDLESDIGETTNVAIDHPDVVERLQTLAEEFQKELRKDRRRVGRVSL